MIRDIFHPSSGGNPVLNGRVFQKWLGRGCEPRQPQKSQALRLGFTGIIFKIKKKIIIFWALKQVSIRVAQ
jgi:hypothetical protein